jgi:type II secretion system (T2SS) protein E
MPRCAHDPCGRWRPALAALGSGRWGVYFDGGWYCSSACVEQAAVRWLRDARASLAPPARSLPPLRIGALLQHQNGLSSGAIRDALDRQRRTGARLGAELVKAGAVTPLDVLRALAWQAGVSYAAQPEVTIGRSVPRDVPVDIIRALGVVPVSADTPRRRLLVACAAPVPRLALSALAQISGWHVEPLLVSEDQLPRLIGEYTRRSEGVPRDDAAVPNLATAASRMARAARAHRARRVVGARCGTHMWLRLDGEDTHEDLLLPIGAFQEVDACRAAPTLP